MPHVSATAILACLFASTVPAAAKTVAVTATEGLAAAMAQARPGDDIVLADGTYLLPHKISATVSGTQGAPITVRAAHRYGAHIRSAGVIAFEIRGAFWSFSGLDIVGVCAVDTQCEHAFHVVGTADGFHLADSRLADFNAHLKVNANLAHALPADGVIENSEFSDSHPRHTDNPVAPINIDDAIGWVVRANLVHDFQKDGAGEEAFGIFVKGGSQTPMIERNTIICADRQPSLGTMVGLSFGAAGMAANLCPPDWSTLKPCDPEVRNGTMRNNAVLNCSGAGIYLNKAAGSEILFNTLLHTQGIVFRYHGSTGEARGNMIDGAIIGQDGGTFHDGGNLTGKPAAAALAAADQPAADPPAAADQPAARAPGASLAALTLPGPDPRVPNDLCGRPRGSRLDAGALQRSLGPCAPPFADPAAASIHRFQDNAAPR